MNKEEFIKQRCEIDKITEEEFEKRYRVVKCNCGQSYCKGYRCLDLDGLLKENQELKEQVQDLKEKIILLKASEPMLELEKYYGERDKYKEVIEEVREYIENYDVFKEFSFPLMKREEENKKDLLQILDKAKGGMNNE